MAAVSVMERRAVVVSWRLGFWRKRDILRFALRASNISQVEIAVVSRIESADERFISPPA